MTTARRLICTGSRAARQASRIASGSCPRERACATKCAAKARSATPSRQGSRAGAKVLTRAPLPCRISITPSASRAL
ncbi:hypothetical protein D3C86_1390920 [compost metagenome]